MKNYRFLLFIFAAIFAPIAASAANVTITSLPGAVADFHPVFSGNSGIVGSFSTNTGAGSAPFTVVVGKSYDVNKLVNGVVMKIGTVSWDAAGLATYLTAP
jgi:hypothetical protein